MLCRLRPRVNCLTGSSYEDVLRSLDEGRVAQWAARDCFPYLGDASSTEDCAQLTSVLCNSELPEGEAAGPVWCAQLAWGVSAQLHQ